MMMKRFISGLSAAAIAASCMAIGASAEAPVENDFYAATGKWVITYSGEKMLADVAKAVDPEGEDWNKDAKGQLVGYTNPETGEVDNYNFGCNIQVGHAKKELVTIKVKSTKDNIFDGEKVTNEAYMYTVQASWNGDSPADYKEGWTHSYNADGEKVMAAGAGDINGWNSGSTKFNGNWAQITLTDDDLAALTFEVTIEADSKTKWEYHPYSAESAADYQYILFNFGTGDMFAADSVTGDGTPKTKASADSNSVVVDGDYINKQIPGAVCKPEEKKYTSIKKAKITVKGTPAYTGKALKPSITVKLDGKTLKSGTDFTAKYKNNTKPGKATVTVTGKGSYIDSASKSFIIVPKKPAKPTVKAGKKQLTVTLKKDKLATGYQITYALNSKFKSAKNVNIAKNSTVKKTIKKLKGGKKYYVKSRSYIKVGKTKYYGKYSAAKAVTVKK